MDLSAELQTDPVRRKIYNRKYFNCKEKALNIYLTTTYIQNIFKYVITNDFFYRLFMIKKNPKQKDILFCVKLFLLCEASTRRAKKLDNASLPRLKIIKERLISFFFFFFKPRHPFALFCTTFVFKHPLCLFLHPSRFTVFHSCRARSNRRPFPR